MKKLLSKLTAITLAVTVLGSLAACGSNNSSSSDSSNNDSGSSTTAAPSGSADSSSADSDKYTESVVYNALESESWDPLRDSTSGGLIKHLFEGLMVWENGELTEGIAKSVDVSEDGLTYTIELKEDAVWSDGKQVTAGDFKYSWLRQLNPDNAGKYAKDLYWIKNGEEYNSGTAAADEVAIDASSDTKLVVILKAPCAYFMELLAARVYLPVREDVAEGNEKWWADPSTCIGNGPYKLVSYTANDNILMEKNDTYREADKVYIQNLTVKFITDSQVELMAYQTDEIQVGIMPPSESLADLEASGDLYSQPKLTCYWLVCNSTQDVISDLKVRKALAMAIDRDSLVTNVTKGGETPAYDLIPPQVLNKSTGEAFNTGSKEYFSYDVEAAKQLLADVGYPNGEGFPELAYAISSGGNHANIAQAIQSMWKENLGITVNIVEAELSVFIADRKSGKYPIARYTWEGSYSDPDTWLSLYTSNSENNDSKYSSSAYDDLIAKAQAETDITARFEYLEQADKMLIADDMAVIPLYYPTNNFLIKSSLKDLGINNNGDLYFKGAYMEK